MKKVCLFLCILLIPLPSFASHFLGADLRYEYTGSNNLYRVYLDVYAECTFGPGLYLSETITFQSLSGNRLFSRVLPGATLDHRDTVWETRCNSPATGCQTSNPYLIVEHYNDTVTLPPNPDWKISWTDGSRNNAIANLQNVASRNIYLEAFLNNSIGPNSSPILAGYPVFFTGPNTSTIETLHVLDADGDSLVGAMYQPLDYNGITIPYNTGYNLSEPFGPTSYTQLDLAHNALKTYGTTTGRYAIAARVYDYRHGVLVGSSSRDWAHTIITATNSSVPYPAPGTSFRLSTCPGQPTSYTVNFVDSVANDSVYLKLTPPSNGATYTVTSSPGIGSATATISWTGPPTWTPATNPFFLIKAFAYNNHCPLRGYSTYNILVKTVPCNSDTVWAGDADANYNVNMYEPFAIGVAYGATGPARPGASLAWTPQWCPNWADTFLTGVNFKHADCDGNGIIDSNDLAGVYANYSLTHPRQYHQPQAKQAGVPSFYFDLTGVDAYSGALVTIPLMLGSSSLPITAYGLSTRISVGPFVQDSVVISTPISWFGNVTNSFQFQKRLSPTSIEWAYVHTDHLDATNGGPIAYITFRIVVGTGFYIPLTLSDTKLITANGSEVTGYNVLDDTLYLNPLSIRHLSPAISNVAIVPNPSSGPASLHLMLSNPSSVMVTITDMSGRIISVQNAGALKAGSNNISLPKIVHAGLYIVQVKTSQDIITLKWLCE